MDFEAKAREISCRQLDCNGHFNGVDGQHVGLCNRITASIAAALSQVEKKTREKCAKIVEDSGEFQSNPNFVRAAEMIADRIRKGDNTMISATEVYLQSLEEEEAISAKLRARISSLEAENARLKEALEPFAEFGGNVDDHGWLSNIHREQISTWFGPSDFNRAREAIEGHRTAESEEATS